MVTFSVRTDHARYADALAAAKSGTEFTDAHALAVAAAFASPRGYGGAALASLATGSPRDHRVIVDAVESELDDVKADYARALSRGADTTELQDNIAALEALDGWTRATVRELIAAGAEDNPTLAYVESLADPDTGAIAGDIAVGGLDRDRAIGSWALEVLAALDTEQYWSPLVTAVVSNGAGVGLVERPGECTDLFAALRETITGDDIDPDEVRDAVQTCAHILEGLGVDIWTDETRGWGAELSFDASRSIAAYL